MSEDFPSVSAVIVGTGRLEGSLKALARQLAIDGQVTFAGYQADVVPWLNRSRVFVLPSDSEGLSLAMMEAMLCGLPCVVSDVGELSELVKDDVTGYLVSERSASAFAHSALRILRDERKREEMSAAARSLMRGFELENITARWTSLLQAWPAPPHPLDLN